jgi:hypothetical protein
MIFRFNPDAYSAASGEKIPSCWRRTKELGLLKVSDEKAWQSRLNTLFDTMSKYAAMPVDQLKEVNIVKLFYDGST